MYRGTPKTNTIGSQSPWHCRTWQVEYFNVNATGSTPPTLPTPRTLTGTVSGHFRTLGKLLCSGSQQDRAITPASGSANVRPAYSASAPPCENPPSMIRFDKMPAFISLWISSCTYRVAFLMPSSSSGSLIEMDFRSNHEFSRKPPFIVTGMFGAVGQITFMSGVRSAPIDVAHPWLKAGTELFQQTETPARP
uniref:Uncharacterized protein n=1 Tax=Anopheles melas TaxID=34690 RepID=A0A182U320_9DIPT